MNRETFLKFIEYHRAHPQAYTEMVACLRHYKSLGLPRYSVKAIWNEMRFKSPTGDKRGLKNPDGICSLYCHLICEKELDLAGFVERRSLRWDDTGSSEWMSWLWAEVNPVPNIFGNAEEIRL
jgi:hypothetical protein